MTSTLTTERPASTRAIAAGLIPLALGTVAWVAGQAVLPDRGLEVEERLTAIAAARGSQSLATVLLFVAGVLFVVTATALRKHTDGGPRPRTAAAGAIALGLGGVWLCAGRAASNLQYLKGTAEGVEPASALEVLSASEGIGFLPFPFTLLALLLAPVLLSIAAPVRDRLLWGGLAAWVVGIGVFMAGEFTNKTLEIGGTALAAAGLLVAATRHLPANR